MEWSSAYLRRYNSDNMCIHITDTCIYTHDMVGYLPSYTPTTCKLTCPLFFELWGGKFFTLFSQLTVIDCGILESPQNGIVVVDMTTLGAVATYTCNASYRLVGMESRRCEENGQWSEVAPTCEGDNLTTVVFILACVYTVLCS